LERRCRERRRRRRERRRVGHLGQHDNPASEAVAIASASDATGADESRAGISAWVRNIINIPPCWPLRRCPAVLSASVPLYLADRRDVVCIVPIQPFNCNSDARDTGAACGGLGGLHLVSHYCGRGHVRAAPVALEHEPERLFQTSKYLG